MKFEYPFISEKMKEFVNKLISLSEEYDAELTASITGGVLIEIGTETVIAETSMCDSTSTALKQGLSILYIEAIIELWRRGELKGDDENQLLINENPDRTKWFSYGGYENELTIFGSDANLYLTEELIKEHYCVKDYFKCFNGFAIDDPQNILGLL